MIPVTPKPQPQDFEARVGAPGKRFLAKTPWPSQKQWKDHAYWQDVLNDLAEAYGRICAYSCQRIEPTTGARSVEHFKPKNDYPKLAYKWDNYRLVSSRLNSRKGRKQILDPFTITEGTFALQFPSLQVVPGPQCTANPGLKKQVDATCIALKLNDESTCIKSRQDLVMAYCEGAITFSFLISQNPFLAGEMKRQKLVDLEAIRRIMSYSLIPPSPTASTRGSK